jgi:hypothetical protein
MRRPNPASQRKFASVDERVEHCPSWVQQDFAQLDAACRDAAPDVNAHDAARAEGRVYYCGANQVKFCRIDPNTRRIGVWFRHDIIDQVRRSGKWRPNRPDGPWIYVDQEDSLEPVIALIRQSSKAALAK